MNGHGPIGYGDVGHVQNGVFRHIDLGVVAVLHGKRARARCTRCYCGVLPGRTWLPRGEAALSSQRRDFAWRRRRCGPRSRKVIVRPRFSSAGRWTASIVRTRCQKLTSPLFDTADLYGHRGGRQWRMELDRGDTMSVEKWRRRDFATESGLSMRSSPPLTKISVSLRLFENEGRSGRHGAERASAGLYRGL